MADRRAGSPKKQLKALLAPQYAALRERMTPRQFSVMCQAQGLGPAISDEMYPHLYLILWLECKRRTDTHGIRPYPDPTKPFYEQDAELMFAFEILDEVEQEYNRADEIRTVALSLAAQAPQSL